MTAQTPRQRRRNRTMLVSIFAIFLGSFALAGVLRFSGWRPQGLKNKGELLQPPADLRGIPLRLADGRAYPWNPVARTWRIAVAPRGNCDAACTHLAGQLEVVRQLFGKDADRVHLLWIGPAPANAGGIHALRLLQSSPQLRAGLPRVDAPSVDGGLTAYVIDPNGFVVLRYAPGFDPGDLRTDMARLLKLK